MEGLNKFRKSFVLQTVYIFLAIKGKINFLQLERFGELDEQTFRNYFDKSYDFLKFNSELLK